MLKKYGFEALGIIFFSAILALAVNHFRPQRLPLLHRPAATTTKTMETASEDRVITLSVLLEKIKQPGTILLDARAPEDFQAGHIPGAKNLPLSEIGEELTPFIQGFPVDLEIITYCDGEGCSLSEELAVELERAGYKRVHIYAGGWEEWTGKHLPVKTGPE